MENSNFDEVDISRIIDIMNREKKPGLYKKCDTPKGKYAKANLEEKQKKEKKKNTPADLEKLAKMRAKRLENLAKRKEELPKRVEQQQAEKIKNALELERLKKKYDEDTRRREREEHRKELVDLIQEQFKQFKIPMDSKLVEEKIKETVQPAVKEIVKEVEKPSKYGFYSKLYS